MLGSVLRELRTRAADGWRATPPGTLPRLLGGYGIAFLLTLGVTALVTVLARNAHGEAWQAWDTRHLLHLRDGTGWGRFVPLSFTDGIILESYANLAILVPLTVGTIGVLLWRGRVAWAIAFALQYLLARLLIWTGWHLWERPRPDLVADGAAALSAHSFPSGHVVLVFTTYGLLALLWARASRSVLEKATAFALLTILAIAVAFARLRLGAHWPSDCLAGGLIGATWLAAAAVVLHVVERHARR